MTDRTIYMRNYMKVRRQRAKAVNSVNAEAGNSVNGELTEERLRAILREELHRALNLFHPRPGIMNP